MGVGPTLTNLPRCYQRGNGGRPRGSSHRKTYGDHLLTTTGSTLPERTHFAAREGRELLATDESLEEAGSLNMLLESSERIVRGGVVDPEVSLPAVSLV